MKSRYLHALLTASLLLRFPAAAQDSARSSQTLDGVLLDDAAAFWGDAGKVFCAPARFGGREWATANLALTATVLLFTTDASIRSFAERNHSRLADDAFEAGRQYGQNLNVLLISGGIYMGGLLLNHEHVRTTGRMVLESALFAGAITTVLKSVTGRSRPDAQEGPYRLRGVQFSAERLSLPSGHATLAFAVSSVLSNRIHNVFASVGLYTLAVVTALSRVYHDDHWLSDTFLGSVVGTSVGITISSREDSPPPSTAFRIFPLPAGVRAEFRF